MMARLRGKTGRDVTLRAVRPNAGIAADYCKKLYALIEEMARSYMRFLTAQYRETPPRMAQDATPAKELERELRQLGRRWERRFSEAAPRLARWFSRSSASRSDAALRKILRDAGFTVRLDVTPLVRDVLDATVAENVSLIKSIGAEFHSQVEGMVMRSVTAGRDLAGLRKDLQHRFRVTRDRAELISLDQNNKATAAIRRARETDLGIEEGIWIHSGAGKEPRPTHVRNNGKRFNIREGWYDPDPRVRRRIMPGELIRCFPGETSLQFGYEIEKAYRHLHRGQLSEIITDSGKTLRATPNHPVLTPDGWVRIGALHEGDHVAEVADDIIRSAVAKGNANDAPSTLAQVFESVAQAGLRRLEVSLRDQFHGDGAPDGHVDIVAAAIPLWIGRQTLLTQSQFDALLTKSDQSPSRLGTIDGLFPGDLFPAARGMRGGRQLLPPAPAFALHALAVGRASIPDLAAGGEYSGNDAGARHAVQLRQRQDAQTGLVLATQFARIVKVDRSSFEGHVYNLQTASGWYVANGIIAHNCRCTWRPVVKGFS